MITTLSWHPIGEKNADTAELLAGQAEIPGRVRSPDGTGPACRPNGQRERLAR